MMVRSSWCAVAVSFVPRRTSSLPPRSGAIVNPPRLGCAASPPVPDQTPTSARSDAHSAPSAVGLGAAACEFVAAPDRVGALADGGVAAQAAPPSDITDEARQRSLVMEPHERSRR